jgi:hypothetical protein
MNLHSYKHYFFLVTRFLLKTSWVVKVIIFYIVFQLQHQLKIHFRHNGKIRRCMGSLLCFIILYAKWGDRNQNIKNRSPCSTCKMSVFIITFFIYFLIKKGMKIISSFEIFSFHHLMNTCLCILFYKINIF